jgi:hypothetical protein
MASGILCQSCGIEAPTKHVEFQQNIGALVMRFSKKYRGHMCKRCVHKYFWQASTTTLFLGPWGTISLIMSPIFLIGNIVTYVGALGMPAVPDGAGVPTLDGGTFDRLMAYRDAIINRLNANEPLASVAASVAAAAGTTPGQVVIFVSHLVQASQSANFAPQPPTGGFPVMPVGGTGAAPPPLPVPAQPV